MLNLKPFWMWWSMWFCQNFKKTQRTYSSRRKTRTATSCSKEYLKNWSTHKSFFITTWSSLISKTSLTKTWLPLKLSPETSRPKGIQKLTAKLVGKKSTSKSILIKCTFTSNGIKSLMLTIWGFTLYASPKPLSIIALFSKPSTKLSLKKASRFISALNKLIHLGSGLMPFSVSFSINFGKKSKIWCSPLNLFNSSKPKPNKKPKKTKIQIFWWKNFASRLSPLPKITLISNFKREWPGLWKK